MGFRSPIVVLGDVGGLSDYHAGDEAMLDANVQGLRRICPGAELVVPSRDPEWTANRYGVRAVARGCVPEADALFVSGGGNLSSTWPDLLLERVELIRETKRRGGRAILVGQTIGPHVGDALRPHLAEALAAADLVGVRESASLALARELGVPEPRLLYQLDDAFFLDDAPVASADAFVALTVHAFVPVRDTSPELARLAERLQEFHEHSGCRYVFLAHQRSGAGGLDDRAVGEDLRLRLPDGMLEVSDVTLARDVACLTRRAEMVVSTRYHPLVFGLSAGVAGVGLSTDGYTDVKLSGALEHAGEGPAVALRALLDGEGLSRLAAVWDRRESIRQRLAGRAEAWRRLEAAKWERVEAVLSS